MIESNTFFANTWLDLIWSYHHCRPPGGVVPVFTPGMVALPGGVPVFSYASMLEIVRLAAPPNTDEAFTNVPEHVAPLLVSFIEHILVRSIATPPIGVGAPIGPSYPTLHEKAREPLPVHDSVRCL